jgi:hypothetical protein
MSNFVNEESLIATSTTSTTATKKTFQTCVNQIEQATPTIIQSKNPTKIIQ